MTGAILIIPGIYTMTDRVFFEWSDAMSVGIPEIDAQHRELINLLNRLFISVVEHDKDKITIEILDALIDYTKTHFALEEELMQRAGYDALEFAAHKGTHQCFVEKVGSAAQKNLLEGKSVSFELIHFLKNWLRHHIMDTDKRYSECLKKLNLEKTPVQPARQSLPEPTDIPAKPWWKIW